MTCLLSVLLLSREGPVLLREIFGEFDPKDLSRPTGEVITPGFLQRPLTCIQQRGLLGGVNQDQTIKPIIDKRLQ